MNHAPDQPPPDDPDEWIRTYRATIRPLYAYASRRAGGDRTLAEDLVQEAWLRALAAWRAKGPPRDPLAWLSTVVRNLAVNHQRRLRPEPLGAGELDLAGETVEPRSTRAAALLGWGLARLCGGQARLFEARHLEGKALAAIAREHGLSERAVEGRLRRARRALRDVLAPYVPDDLATPGTPGASRDERAAPAGDET